jgi:hypothetical protein
MSIFFMEIIKVTTIEERNAFSLQIEKEALEKQIPILEAIMDHCEKTGLEIEVVHTLINKPLKEKIRQEASDRRLLVKDTSTKLPL